MPAFWTAYKLVWKRRRLRWRAFRSRHALRNVVDRTADVRPGTIRAFMCVRNEMLRLPHALEHYRKLGVGQFLIVDNGSTDGTSDFLKAQPDVSLWQCDAPYRQSGFGRDWMNWLLSRYGHGAWCVLVDADELLVYPHCDTHDLHALIRWLDKQGQKAFGALMLDLYPRDAIGESGRVQNPLDTLKWFDAGPYRAQRQAPMGNLWVQGGARDRVFFSERPHRAPTLNKLPLVRWHRRFAFVNSTHSILPRRLNYSYDGPRHAGISGVLLHTKFLPDVIARAEEDLDRKQHFHQPEAFASYYDAIREAPNLWHADAVHYDGWQRLVACNLMSSGGFPDG